MGGGTQIRKLYEQTDTGKMTGAERDLRAK